MKEPSSILSQWKIDKSWTLFLDRDGVVNQKMDNDYVKTPAEFIWIPGVLESMEQLTSQFQRVVVVTNQQGVGKGLMSTKDLAIIHQKMWEEIEAHGGKLDAIYFAPQLAAQQSVYRKPKVGMGLKAKQDFPEISFPKSIMVGDSKGDILFGKSLGMKTVWIGDLLITQKQQEIKADIHCSSLADFSSILSKGMGY